MARRSLRDRLLTPSVAQAMMSPLSIVLYGAGTAVAIVAGAPFFAAAAVGAAAWGANVARQIPRDTPGTVAPLSLAPPWSEYVVGAQIAKQRFDNVVGDMQSGPLKERLATLAGRLDDGVQESWRIAKRGNDISQALGRLSPDQTLRELDDIKAQAEARPDGPTSAMTQTITSLEAQLASGNRLKAIELDAKDRLRLLDARFDELVARAVEVSVGTGDSEVLGNEVDGLVDELESLRVAMDETQHAASEIAPGSRPASAP